MTPSNFKTSLAAVVVTYNRRDALKETIQAYNRAGVDSLVVVDNASTDGTEEYLQAAKKALGGMLHVIRTEENLGGAGGFHLGIQYARDHQLGDWLVISDDDSYPKPESLTLFKQRVEAGVYPGGMVSAKVSFPNGDLCPMNRPMAQPSVRKALSNWLSGGRPSQIQGDSLSANGIEPILAASFVGMFVQRKVLEQTGVLPQSDFFLYWDDIAFCLDMGKAGQGIVFDPGLDFVHDCPRSSAQLAGQRLYFMVRNGYRTIARLPLKVRLAAYPYKTINWLYLALKSRSLGWYLKALKEI
ncbi:glycosyltransferase [Ferrimonas marina]|uniref:Glycosyltransferase, GT2 family n=1 Tax=Ferrimonas marina TaxID=299255 RepID=A0A1M5VJG3_9GAMM|nr:glycosyltransferase [Ferrimonas marina]SHH75345.1 Glycosyltransferase, GT2 family [Ferrimonas marina]